MLHILRNLRMIAVLGLLGVTLVTLVASLAYRLFPALRETCVYVIWDTLRIQVVLLGLCLVLILIERCRQWFGGRSTGHQAELGPAE